eukprot:scaffold2599_cov125-Cylindrotheca_fusiformis.AAC.13
MESESMENPLDILLETLENPETHILPLLSASKEKGEMREKLIGVVKHLFQQNEIIAKKYQELTKKNNDDEPAGLSGLDEMITGDGIDIETMWGQVELQNAALNKLVKKSTKRLEKSVDKITVLDLSKVLSESESEEDEEEDSNSSDGESDDDQDSHGKENGSVDSTTRRMEERMKRAMEDMDSGDESDDADRKPAKETEADAKKSDDEESLEDPVADQMKDGFFDLNEMEDFADEEEDYLPEEAFGQPKKVEKKNKKSFHQRQRDGDFENDSDDDEEEEDLEAMYEDTQPVKRKKYRDDEDIDALYTLYQPTKEEDDEYGDEEAEEDPASMTAADFFGKPKMQYYEKYYKKGKKPKGVTGRPKDDDEDSWGGYDFENEDQAGWRDENAAAEGEEKAESDDDGSDDESEEEKEDEKQAKEKSKAKSVYAKQSEKLRRQTEQLEKEMIAEKPWQMTGETTSATRPVNSLLEGTPEFEMASKQAPTITVEQTASLEEIIKQRILAEDWDDVVPRELPDVGWHKKRGELPEVSQEKSKLGLGELYEREYLKKAIGYDVDAAEKKTEEDNAKDEMKQLFANLCSKLDALSNYHFAPRPIADEAEVRPVTAPAIAMEEVLPLHVSDARGVAPEEVYATKRGREGVIRGDNELEQTDRKRLRSSKKAARRKARKEKLADDKLISRLEPGLGLNNPYEKRKMREELETARSRGRVTTGEREMETKFGTSGTFFKRLQAEAQESLQKGSTKKQDTKKVSKAKSSVYKL